MRDLFHKWRNTQHTNDGKLVSIETLAARASHKQSAFSQRLNGTMALNKESAIHFAKLIGCEVADFSPTLAAEIANLGAAPHGLEQKGHKLSPEWAKNLSESQILLTTLVLDHAGKLTEKQALTMIALFETWVATIPQTAKKQKVKA